MNSDSPLYLQCLSTVYSYEKLLFVVYLKEFQLIMFSVESSMNAPTTGNAKLCQFSSAVFEKFNTKQPRQFEYVSKKRMLISGFEWDNFSSSKQKIPECPQYITFIKYSKS